MPRTNRKQPGKGSPRRDEAEAKPSNEEVVIVEERASVSSIMPDLPPPGEGSGVSAAKKDRFLPISIVIAAVLIGGALVFSALYHGTGTGVPAGGAGGAGAAAGTQAGPSGVATATIMTLGPRDAILGNANAPVTLIEYGDYQCPFCTQFFSQTQPQVMSNYINTGKVRMVFRNFPFLGPESTAAAEAAECANDQGKFWPYHEALYQAKVNDEKNGGGENDGYFTRALFISLAQQNGLDVATFTNCVDSNKYATTVTKEQQTATAAGVDSTPTFFVNGTEILGAQPYAAFQSAIDAALKG